MAERRAAALRHELERAGRPLEEALGTERLRLLPDALVVVRAVEIEEHARSGAEVVAVPFEVLARHGGNSGKERIEAPDLLDEAFGEGVVLALERSR